MHYSFNHSWIVEVLLALPGQIFMQIAMEKNNLPEFPEFLP